jgi:hypothetical protein
MFDIVPKNVSIATGKKNLSQIAKVLGQITSGVEFDNDKPSYIPINDFVRNAIAQLSNWFIQGVPNSIVYNLFSSILQSSCRRTRCGDAISCP